MSPWLFNVYMDSVMKVKMGMGWRGVRFQEEEREFRLPGLLYGETWFCVVSRRNTCEECWDILPRCIEEVV